MYLSGDVRRRKQLVRRSPFVFSSFSGTNVSHHPKDVIRSPRWYNRSRYHRLLILCNKFLTIRFGNKCLKICFYIPTGNAQADINWSSAVEWLVHWRIGHASAPLSCITNATKSRVNTKVFVVLGRVLELSFGLFPKFKTRKRDGPKPTQFVRTIACA